MTGKEFRRLISKNKMPAGILKIRELIEKNKNEKEYKNKKIIEIISDEEVLKQAYINIKSKPGNMTKGTDGKTLDGMSNDYFSELRKELRTGAFKFKSSKRIEIPKKNGGTRSLGIGSPREKIVQESMRIVMEGI